MWKFKLPTEIIFGEGSVSNIEQIAEPYGSKKMVVTDSSLAGMDFIKSVISNINNKIVFSEVRPNPSVENVDTLTRLLREEKIDSIIAIGGGSSIDCAKAASCLALTEEESIRSFHSEGKVLGAEHLPVIAVPTTAGTGSEVTPFSVLDDVEKNIKGPIAADAFYPVAAIVDPELTYSVPETITAATALDSLSHAIEGYWSKNNQPICSTFSIEAAKSIFSNLEKVLSNPSDKEGRKALSYAALLAGMAFQLPKNAIMHACSFPLSNRFHLSHGAACAFTMELSIKLNAPHMDGRMEEFSEACGFSNLEEMITKITDLKKSGKLPCTLEDAGIEAKDIEMLVNESMHPLMNNNPKAVSKEDLHVMYEQLNCIK